MIGRAQELGSFERAQAKLDAGQGHAIVLSGEPGIGKTRLLAEARARSEERGDLVLAGRSAEFERELPFGALVDALDDYLGSLNPRRFAALDQQQQAELAHILPALRSLETADPAGPQDERYRSHGAMRALLELLAARKPLVLTLDDLHWADEATVELLSHLLRRRPRRPVLLALAFRSAQAPATLAAAIEDARREGALTEIELHSLDEQEADHLLDQGLDPELRSELFRLSGGNPFYLEELTRHASVPSAAALSPGTPDSLDLPPPVASALAVELAELPAGIRTLAQGAAIAGDSFEPELAAAAAETSEREALAAIDELLGRDVLRTTEAPRRFRFRHPIVHAAVYQSAKPGWRLAAHGRVAATLEEAGAAPLRRAPHVESSAKPGDEVAIEVLREAGEAAALRAPAAAAHWYAAALRLVPADDLEVRLGLLVPRAQALGYSGRLEDAREALDELLAALPPDALEVRSRVVGSAARIDQVLGNHQAARELVVGALGELPEQAGPEAAQLKLQLAASCFFEGDFPGLRDWVQEALKGERAEDGGSIQAAATGLLGCAEYMVGDMPAARERLAEAESSFAGLPDPELARHHSLTWCGICEVYLERFDRADALLDRAMQVASSTGHGHIKSLTRVGQSLILLWKGDLERAAELLEISVEAAMLARNDQFLAWALWARCWAAILGGELADAIRYGERALRCGGGAADPVSAVAGCYLAEARLEAGEPPESCRDQLLDAVGGAEMPLVERGFQAHWYELLARAELAAGRIEAAAAWASRAEAAADGLGIDGRTAEALRARGAVSLARGDPKAAAAEARDSAKAAEAAGLPIEAARSRLLAGRALASFDRGAAVPELERAHAALDHHGASRYRDEAARELRALGERTTRPKRGRAGRGEGVAGLSAREREVAELVAEGKTNKGIAAELYLSEKTIESHLSRIFEKLGASKRAQVAAAVGREREPAGG